MEEQFSEETLEKLRYNRVLKALEKQSNINETFLKILNKMIIHFWKDRRKLK